MLYEFLGLLLLLASAPGSGHASGTTTTKLFPVPAYEFGVHVFSRDGPLPPLGSYNGGVGYMYQYKTQTDKCTSALSANVSGRVNHKYCAEWHELQVGGDGSGATAKVKCALKADSGRYCAAWVSIKTTSVPLLVCPDGSGGYSSVTGKEAGFERRRQLRSWKFPLSESVVDGDDLLTANAFLIGPTADVGGRRILRKSGSAGTRKDADGLNVSGCSVQMDNSITVKSCECRVPAPNGHFCMRWQCIKFNDDGRGATAHEDYNCTASHNNASATSPAVVGNSTKRKVVHGLSQLPSSFYASSGATLTLENEFEPSNPNHTYCARWYGG